MTDDLSRPWITGTCRELKPLRHGPEGWYPGRSGNLRLDHLDLATFNVWFGDLAMEARADAVLALLEARRPHLVGLQEVTPAFLARLQARPWVREHYALSDVSGETLRTYGVLAMTRLPGSRMFLHDLPTQMGRRLLVVEVVVNGAPFRFGTVHLESLSSEGMMRGMQLSKIFPVLAEAPHSVLCGDLNFCSTNQVENERLDPEYVDLWPALHPDQPGWTEDTNVNLMRLDIKSRRKQVRFDRVLLRGGGAWAPERIEILGTEPISSEEPRIFPSDHFGLFARVSFRSDPAGG